MFCACFGGSSFEDALRKGDIPLVLSHLSLDPLTIACTTFRHGDTLWHVIAHAGHAALLAVLATRLANLWPSPPPPAPPSPQPPNPSTPVPSHPPYAGLMATSHFRPHTPSPFQRLSDGLLLGRRVTDPTTRSLSAFLSAANVLGQTALMVACRRGHAECVRLLLALGADPWCRDRGNCTALHYAALRNQGGCIQAVLSHPASARPPAGTRTSLVRLVDLPNFCGYTPAHFAAAAGNSGAMAALLAGGANIAARCWAEGVDWISGTVGSTPLHFAARRGDMGMCRLVLSHYYEVLRDSGTPDPRLHADVKGLRSVQVASARGNRALAEMLMPSTPLTLIFAGTDVVRLYNVPKLKALASAAFQEALLAQINDVEMEAVARRRRMMAAATAVAAALCNNRGGAATAAAGAAPDMASAVAVAAVSARTDVSQQPSALERATSLMASLSGAVDHVRRQSLRSVQSLQQTLRRLNGGGTEAKGQAYASTASICASPEGGSPRTVYGTSTSGPRWTSQGCGAGGGDDVQHALQYGNTAPVSTAAAVAGAVVGGAAHALSDLSTPPSIARTANGCTGHGYYCPPAPGESTSMDDRLTSLPGGVSPVRGSSYDGDAGPQPLTGFPSFTGTPGGGGIGTAAATAAGPRQSQMPESAVGVHSPYQPSSRRPSNSEAAPAMPPLPPPKYDSGIPTGVRQADPAVCAVGRPADASDCGEYLLDTSTISSCHQANQNQPLLTTAEKAPTAVSPFAAPAIQGRSLPSHSTSYSPSAAPTSAVRGSGNIPPYGPPTADNGSAATAAVYNRPARARSPPRSNRTAVPATTLGLHPVDERDDVPEPSDSSFRGPCITGDAQEGQATDDGHHNMAPGPGAQPPIRHALHQAGPPFSSASPCLGVLLGWPQHAPPPASASQAWGDGVVPTTPPSALMTVSAAAAAGVPGDGPIHAEGTSGGGVGWRPLVQMSVGQPAYPINMPGGGGGGNGAEPCGYGSASGCAMEPAGGSPKSSGALGWLVSALRPGGGQDTAAAGGGLTHGSFQINVGAVVDGAAAASGSAGGGGGGPASRRGSGCLARGSGLRTGSGLISGTATGAGGVGGGAAGGVEGLLIGSETSEDFCGICFERVTFHFIQPCQHQLCAECAREVTRMVETQPPRCPFCRSVVRGFTGSPA